MTDKSPNSKRLLDLIKSKNISIDFLSSRIDNVFYFSEKWNEDNLLWKFKYDFNTFYYLLQKDINELLKLRAVGVSTITNLNDFFSFHNCEIGMFKEFTISDFDSITQEQISLEDLTESEKSISLVLLNYLVKTTPNDAVLGQQIRRIFNTIK
jgi:hypothetical protein